jgi:hypothetical protein
VSFLVDGVRHRGAEQVDSIVETVDLGPGQAISTGVLVSASDRGLVLPDAGPVGVRVAIRPPGPSDEVLSDAVVVDVVDDEEAAARGRALTRLDAAARALRDSGSSDVGEVIACLRDIEPENRVWAATALLPAAPLPDDGLLRAARRVIAEGGDDGVARAVLDGEPHEPHAAG